MQAIPTATPPLIGQRARAKTDARARGAWSASALVVSGTLMFSPVLIRAPALFGDQPPLVVYAVTLAPFCAALACMTLLHRARWRPARSTVLACAYVAMIVVAAFRGIWSGTLSPNAATLESVQILLLALLGALAFLRDEDDSRRARYIRALCWAPAVFLAVNVVLHFGGIVAADQELAGRGFPATLLGLVGVDTTRVLFPLSGGLNGIGPTAVAALVISVTLMQRGQQFKLALLGALISLYVILTIDSRGALLFAALAIALVTLWPHARKRGLGWLALALPLLPIILILALTGLAETDVGASLNRDADENISTGTGRTVVWGEIVDVLADPGVEHVFGYGQFGQVPSGASVNYAYLFRHDPDPLSHSAHSLILQTALDIGWVGVLCLLALSWAVLNRLGRLTRDPYHAALLAAVVGLLLLGVVQADPTPAHPDSFGFWLLVLFAAIRADDPPTATSMAATRPRPRLAR